MIKLFFTGTKGEIEEQNKKHHYHSSLILEHRGFRLLIDYGEIQRDLNKIKPNAILITHAHPDHYVWTKKQIQTKIPVYLTKETLNYGKFKPENWKIISSGKKFRLESFTILPYNVIHSIKCQTVGFKIFADKKIIVYNPDLVDIVNKNKILKNVDYYIGDGASIRANLVRKKEGKLFGHARISTQINWCKKAGIDTIIFTHLGKETIKKENEFRKKNPGIIFAHDGLRMDI